MATITLPQEVAKAVAAEKERSRGKAKDLEREIDTLKKGVRESQASNKSLKQSMEEKDKDVVRQLKGHIA